MIRLSSSVVCLVLLLTPSAFAGPGAVELDVSDLVEMRTGSGSLPVGWRILPSFASPGRLILGETDVLCGLGDDDFDPERRLGVLRSGGTPFVQALIREADLEKAIASMAGLAGDAVQIEDGRLAVSAEDAPAVRAALAVLRKTGPPIVRVDARLDALVPKAPPAAILTMTGPVGAGQPYVFADAEEASVLTDFEVEIAQGSVIANPVMQVRRTGASLLVRVRPLPAGGRAIVEAVVRVAEPLPEKPIDLGHPGFGPLDRCRTGIEEAAVTFLVENGKPAHHLWTGRNGRRLRFTLTAAWRAPAGGEQVLWSRMLEGSVAGFRNLRRAALDLEGDDDHLRATAEAPGLLRALADADRDAHATPLHVDVFLVPAGAPVSPGGSLPEGASERVRVRTCVLPGLPACFNGSREMLYLADWDVEVAQSARIPDPILNDVQEGHFLEATVLRRGETRRVQLDLELLTLAGIERRVRPINVAQSSLGVQGTILSQGSGGNRRPSGSTITAPSMPQDTIALEQPRLRTLRIEAEVPLGPDGSGMLRRSARGFTGKAQDVVVVVRCPKP